MLARIWVEWYPFALLEALGVDRLRVMERTASEGGPYKCTGEENERGD